MSIEIKKITKTFGNFTALEKVNLNIQDGELVALLGPSGSGKTTLLRVIAGIEMPDEGDIIINGKNYADVSVRNRGVGFVFQHYALFKHMSVFENVAFGLRVRPKATRPTDEQINKKVSELLHLVQLERMAHRFPHELSGGQKQRVALSRALAVEPKVLLLDEPFGALDAKVRRDLRHWLRRLHDEIHVTSVFVTHDQEEALEVADRIVVLNEGKIQQIGTPEEVYHKPANSFVYNFLGSVNLFHGRVEGGRVYLGDKQVDLGSQDPSKATSAIYVRPHSLEISKEALNKDSLKATIKYLNTAGPVVKIELLNDKNELIRVEIPHERYQQLHLKKDDVVFVNFKDVKVFKDDYSI